MNEVKQVELSIQQAKELIAKRDRLMRLTKNRDFKALVIDGYFQEEAAHLVQELAYAPSPEIKEDMISQVESIGIFRRYLNAIDQQGQAAANALQADQETLEELLAEQL